MDWTCLEVTQVGCLVGCHCVTVIGWQIYLYSSVCVCGGGGGGYVDVYIPTNVDTN